MSVWGIVVAAGSGNRFGAQKQFVALNGVRLVDRAVTTATAVCDHVVVVLPPREQWTGPPVTGVAVGGATRSASVRAGLASVDADADIVVVHDAARPLASAELFSAVVDAVRGGADAAVPGVPLPDTVKRVVGDRITATVPRDDLVAVQTPQAFRSSVLRSAHADGGDATDDAALVEDAGGIVVLVAGDPRNIKITANADLAVALALEGVGVRR